MQYIKVNRKIARKLHDAGKTLAVLPCLLEPTESNVHFFGEFIQPEYDFYRTSEGIRLASCSARHGRYPAYWVLESDYPQVEQIKTLTPVK